MGIHQRMNRTMKASEVLPLTVAEIERDIQQVQKRRRYKLRSRERDSACARDRKRVSYSRVEFW